MGRPQPGCVTSEAKGRGCGPQSGLEGAVRPAEGDRSCPAPKPVSLQSLLLSYHPVGSPGGAEPWCGQAAVAVLAAQRLLTPLAVLVGSGRLLPRRESRPDKLQPGPLNPFVAESHCGLPTLQSIHIYLFPSYPWAKVGVQCLEPALGLVKIFDRCCCWWHLAPMSMCMLLCQEREGVILGKLRDCVTSSKSCPEPESGQPERMVQDRELCETAHSSQAWQVHSWLSWAGSCAAVTVRSQRMPETRNQRRVFRCSRMKLLCK